MVQLLSKILRLMFVLLQTWKQQLLGGWLQFKFFHVIQVPNLEKCLPRIFDLINKLQDDLIIPYRNFLDLAILVHIFAIIDNIFPVVPVSDLNRILGDDSNILATAGVVQYWILKMDFLGQTHRFRNRFKDSDLA